MDATFEVVNPKIVTDDDAESENEVGVEDTEGKPDIEEAMSETGEDIEETKGSLQNADDGSAEKPKLFQGVSSKSVHVTLRNNFVPILISPRVTDIPIKVKLTMLAFAVIVLISIGISEYLREINKVRLSRNKICVYLTCVSSLLLRKRHAHRHPFLLIKTMNFAVRYTTGRQCIMEKILIVKQHIV